MKSIGIPYGLGKHDHEVDKSKATAFGIVGLREKIPPTRTVFDAKVVRLSTSSNSAGPSR